MEDRYGIFNDLNAARERRRLKIRRWFLAIACPILFFWTVCATYAVASGEYILSASNETGARDYKELANPYVLIVVGGLAGVGTLVACVHVMCCSGHSRSGA